MKRKYLSLAIGVVLVAPAMPAWSQEETAAEYQKEARTTQLDTVTVTARKREETLQEVPVAVTAFTPERLDTLNVEDLADIATQVPNTQIYAARGSSSTVTAYIRGVGQSDPLWGVDPGVGVRYLLGPKAALGGEARFLRADVSVALRVEGEGRRATLSAASELGERWLDSAIQQWEASAGG